MSKPQTEHGNLTIFGRKPVLEALQDDSLACLKVHFADSNKQAGIIHDINRLAEQRQVPVAFHSKQALSRISKNGKQDQGVALDLRVDSLRDSNELISSNTGLRLIALDRVNNPQNLGMAIRSVGASPMDGLLIAQDKGTTRISPLVIKASAGAFFKTPIYRCFSLAVELKRLKEAGYNVIALSAAGNSILSQSKTEQKIVYVLGNETEGLSPEVSQLADEHMQIPMARDIESLNLAVTAALVAFIAG